MLLEPPGMASCPAGRLDAKGPPTSGCREVLLDRRATIDRDEPTDGCPEFAKLRVDNQVPSTWPAGPARRCTGAPQYWPRPCPSVSSLTPVTTEGGYETPTAASPYSTGGGGTVLEHRYGAVLLAHLLTGDPVTELGDDLAPVQVAFQASAFSPVDDLVVGGRSADGAQRQGSIGVRRNPSLIPSDEPSVQL